MWSGLRSGSVTVAVDKAEARAEGPAGDKVVSCSEFR